MKTNSFCYYSILSATLILSGIIISIILYIYFINPNCLLFQPDKVSCVSNMEDLLQNTIIHAYTTTDLDTFVKYREDAKLIMNNEPAEYLFNINLLAGAPSRDISVSVSKSRPDNNSYSKLIYIAYIEQKDIYIARNYYLIMFTDDTGKISSFLTSYKDY